MRKRLIPARAHHKVFNMTGGKCFYCGGPVRCRAISDGRDWLHISPASSGMVREHKVPVIRGGQNHKSNYVPACVLCNSIKGPFTTDEFRFVRALQAGDMNFVFPFEPSPQVRRDWLCCHSSEFERLLVEVNMPESVIGYNYRHNSRQQI